MRGWLAPCLAALFLAGIPCGQAQAEAPLLADPAEDVQLTVQGQATPMAAPAGTYTAVDLLGLRVAESGQDITFRVELSDLPAPDQDAEGSGGEVFFRHADRQFRLAFGHLLPAVADGWSMVLQARDEGQQDWSQLWFSYEDAIPDYAADSVSIAVPRILLADALGAPPFPGRSLDDLHAASWSGLSRVSLVGATPEAGPGVSATDAMPDAGGAPASYAIRLGPQQTGHARLTSAQPFRASNGEAGTFLLNVTAHNLGDAADRFTLRPTQAMPGAELRVPEPEFSLDGGASRSFQVLLTVPFAHEHGQTRSVVLEMQSEADSGSTGRLELGVLYLPVPQPAGHHDTLYIHTGDDPTPLKPASEAMPGVYGIDVWMNTLADDPTDGGLGSPPMQTNIINPDKGSWEWWVFLDGGLRLGLDVDLGRLGSLSLPFTTNTPILGATASAELQVFSWEGQAMGERLVVATMAPTAPADITDRESRMFTGDLVPSAGADLVPFRDGQEMMLVVRLEGTSPVSFPAPCITSGGSMTVPLLEYQDPLDPMLATAPVVAEGAATGASGVAKESPVVTPPVLAAALVVLATVVARFRR